MAVNAIGDISVGHKLTRSQSATQGGFCWLPPSSKNISSPGGGGSVRDTLVSPCFPAIPGAGAGTNRVLLKPTKKEDVQDALVQFGVLQRRLGIWNVDPSQFCVCANLFAVTFGEHLTLRCM